MSCVSLSMVMLQVLSSVDGIFSTFSSCGLWGSPQAPPSLGTIQAALQEQHRQLVALHSQASSGPSLEQDPTGEVVVLLTQLVAEGVGALRSQVGSLLCACPRSSTLRRACCCTHNQCCSRLHATHVSMPMMCAHMLHTVKVCVC
jgi:hypothetical protein